MPTVAVRGLRVLALALVGFVAAACGGSVPVAKKGVAGQPAGVAAGAATHLPIVHIAYVNKSASLLPLWVAQDAGYFQKNGVGVKLEYIPGGVQTIKAVISGSDQMGTFGDLEIIDADTRGANIVEVASMVDKPFFWIYGKPGIASIAALKGKRVGFGGKGTLTEFALATALTQSGMTEHDVTLETFPAQPSQFAALKAGSISAGVFPPPFSVLAQQQHFHLLFSPNDVHQASTALGLSTTRTFLQKHAGEVSKVLAAYVQGLKRMETDRAFALRSLEKHLQINAKIAGETYDAFKGLYSNPPVETLASMQATLAFVKRVNPSVGSPDLTKMFDMKLLRPILGSKG